MTLSKNQFCVGFKVCACKTQQIKNELWKKSVRRTKPRKDLTRESGTRNGCVCVCVCGSAPRSTLVSLHIHNISLHAFNLPISKTLSVHPDGDQPAAYSFVAFSSKWWKVRGKSKTKCRAKKWEFNICSYPLNEIQLWWLRQKGIISDMSKYLF